METAQIEAFRARLLALKAELEDLDEKSAEAAKPVELDQARVGRLSRMDAMQAQEMALESGRRRRRQLVLVDGALRRIETGSFGNCFVCGEEINTSRLTADPTVTRCVSCADA